MKAFLDHFAAILGALTLTILMLSISHEYGYFMLVGLHFQTLLTATDYFANGILWVPFTMFFIVSADWRAIIYRKPEVKRNWKDWRAWLLPIFGILFLAFLLISSSWPPSPLHMTSYTMLIGYYWTFLMEYLYKPIVILGDELNAVYEKVVKLGPPVLAVMFLWGWIAAGIDLQRTHDPYLVRFKNERAELRILLRSFDRGVLMKNLISNRIEFYRWDDIVSLEKQSSGKSASLLCYFFGYTCISPPPPTP